MGVWTATLLFALFVGAVGAYCAISAQPKRPRAKPGRQHVARPWRRCDRPSSWRARYRPGRNIRRQDVRRRFVGVEQTRTAATPKDDIAAPAVDETPSRSIASIKANSQNW